MCTVLLGVDVVRPGSVILAGNRDESPLRKSEGPQVLRASPRVAGGRDAVAGGTWLAIRERRAAVALLNRRPAEALAAPAPLLARSRGLLALDAASLVPGDGGTLSRHAASRLRSLVTESSYAPFSLLWAAPEGSWIAYGGPGATRGPHAIGRGWHVVTHADLDDAREPRTAWLIERLRGVGSRDPRATADELLALLRTHGDGNRVPEVCIHDGRMATVSASAVYLADGDARYWHLDGRPCEGAWTDHTPLLAEPSAKEDA